MRNKLKFKGKIFAAFSIILIFTLVSLASILFKIKVMKSAWDTSVTLNAVQEMRNSINACGINARDLKFMKGSTDISNRKDWIENAMQNYKKSRKDVGNLVKVNYDKDLLKEIDSKTDKYFSYLRNIISSKSSADISDDYMIQLSLTEKSLFNDLDSLVQNESNMSSTSISQGEGVIKYIITMSIVIIFGIIAITLILAQLLNKDISKPINEISLNLRKYANGDFTCQVPESLIGRKDEIGELSSSLDTMKEHLSNLFKEISSCSSELSSSSSSLSNVVTEITDKFSQVSKSTGEILQEVHDTSASSEEINASVEEVDSSINQLSQKAQDGSGNSSGAKERAIESRKRVEEVIDKIGEIYSEKEQKILRSIEEGKVVNDIKTMSETVASIAEQINLLALNAAIEAARAGEQGKGFAVVADEVKNLAEQSKESVTVIQDTILKVQGAFKNMSDTGRDLLAFIQQHINPEFDNFKKVGESYYSDSDFVNKMSEDIAAMSEELTATIDQVSSAVQNMTEIAQKTSENTNIINENIEKTLGNMKHVEKSADDQLGVSRKLENIMKEFKI